MLTSFEIIIKKKIKLSNIFKKKKSSIEAFMK